MQGFVISSFGMLLLSFTTWGCGSAAPTSTRTHQPTSEEAAPREGDADFRRMLDERREA